MRAKLAQLQGQKYQVDRSDPLSAPARGAVTRP
jgi:hypothetical protein